MQENNKLTKHWLLVYFVVLTVFGYNFVCHYYGAQIQAPVDEAQRVVIRTILYIAAILLLPLTNLMRFILLRLNQTMPGEKTAAERYFVTILITQTMVEIIAIFGLIVFVLGDDTNNLIIFSTMALLGAALHRPKIQDLRQIETEMKARIQSDNRNEQ